MKIIKYISKIINRISLIGKFVHLYRIKKAKQILHKIKEINSTPNNGGRVINYLRKINPYVFEELVLSVIENSNVRVVRNKSYSNDGGIDGIFKLSKGKVLVQCKRYKSYINPKDVMQLSQTVKEQKYYFGIFVHTGKTGEKSKDNIKIENNTMIISGSLLINFLVGNNKIMDLIEKKKINNVLQ